MTLGNADAKAASEKGIDSIWLGTLGELWFKTIAGAARLNCSKHEPDIDGVDFTVEHTRSGGRTLWQIKTTASANWLAGDAEISLSMSTERLAVLKDTSARSFMLLVVSRAPAPDRSIAYVGGRCHGGAVMRLAGYYREIDSAFELASTETTTVRFDRTSLLSSSWLHTETMDSF